MVPWIAVVSVKSYQRKWKELGQADGFQGNETYTYIGNTQSMHVSPGWDRPYTIWTGERPSKSVATCQVGFRYHTRSIIVYVKIFPLSNLIKINLHKWHASRAHYVCLFAPHPSYAPWKWLPGLNEDALRNSNFLGISWVPIAYQCTFWCSSIYHIELCKLRPRFILSPPRSYRRR